MLVVNRSFDILTSCVDSKTDGTAIRSSLFNGSTGSLLKHFSLIEVHVFGSFIFLLNVSYSLLLSFHLLALIRCLLFYQIRRCCDILRIRWESTRSRTKERALTMMDKLVCSIFANVNLISGYLIIYLFSNSGA